ncbi:MAG: RNA degradosome polyphosphate kinase [Bdellovibrionales bacterium]
MHDQPDIAQAAPIPSDPRRFINREVSWLAFDRRVIEEALNTRHPLFERIRFLAISASNLDEFMAVRVASIEAQHASRLNIQTDDGLTPRQHLAIIDDHISQLLNDQRSAWFDLHNELAKAGIVILEPHELGNEDVEWIEKYFNENIFLALTPLAVDPAHPFPFITNGGVALALQLRDKSRKADMNVILPLPLQIPRFIRLPAHEDDTTIRFVMLEAVIEKFLDRIFPLTDILAVGEFRVIRDTEVRVTNNVEADDYVHTFESALKTRYRGAIIRLSVSNEMPAEMRDFLTDELNVTPEKVVVRSGILRLGDIRQLIIPERPDLLFPPYEPRFPERIREFNGDCFAAISHKDIVVHHPYETFDVVLQFLRQATNDPNVVAIKQTLYRTSKDSPIVQALVEAAAAGKSVTAMVELKARFDEEANIRWARDLERAGAQVVFGFMELKTHAKMTLIVRRENNALRSYVHFGTGNYHNETARIYTDLSYFTCDADMCQDAAAMFNYMTGYAKPKSFHKLAVAPLTLRQTLNQLIADEIAHARAGKPAQIWAKLNALVDADIIDRLYEASNAGVHIDLVVRGACCLRPGVPELSENIRIKSIVGRFLEHSRIVAFGAGHGLPHDSAKVFMSSADWMPRNLDRRIETLVPIENATVHQQVLDQIMVANFKDTRQSWEMLPDGTYRRFETTEEDFSAHDYFMTNPSLSGRGANLSKKSLPPRLKYQRRPSHARKDK